MSATVVYHGLTADVLTEREAAFVTATAKNLPAPVMLNVARGHDAEGEPDGLVFTVEYRIDGYIPATVIDTMDEATMGEPFPDKIRAILREAVMRLNKSYVPTVNRAQRRANQRQMALPSNFRLHRGKVVAGGG